MFQIRVCKIDVARHYPSQISTLMSPLFKKSILLLFISPLFFLLGYIGWAAFFNAVLPVNEGLQFNDEEIAAPFQQRLIFSLTLALIPVLSLLIWEMAPVVTGLRKCLVAGLLVLSMAASIFIRRELIIREWRDQKTMVTYDMTDPENPVPREEARLIPLSALQFEMYGLIGLVSGSIIAFLLFRRKAGRHSPPATIASSK